MVRIPYMQKVKMLNEIKSKYAGDRIQKILPFAVAMAPITNGKPDKAKQANAAAQLAAWYEKPENKKVAPPLFTWLLNNQPDLNDKTL